MGRALYVVLERDIPGLDAGLPRRALAAAEPRLRLLCRELGVKDLSKFFSDDPDTMLQGYVEEDSDELAPDFDSLGPEQWFPTSEGLETVRALKVRLEQDRDIIRGTDQVLAELDQIESILVEAEDHSIGWHLAMEN